MAQLASACENGDEKDRARKITRRGVLSADFRGFERDTAGATAAEYALMIALISSLIMTGLSPVGQSIAASMSSAASGLQGNSGSPPPKNNKKPKQTPKKKKK